jgi:Holliday junction resolvase-like predicted endonuclease
LGEVSEYLGLTPQRVCQLVKEGVVPRVGRGEYDLVAAFQGYIAYLRENSESEERMGISEAKQRKLAAEAQLAELTLEQEKKKLVRVDAIEEYWVGIVTAAKTKFLAMPNRLSPLLVGQEKIASVHKILQEAIVESLNELAKGEDIESATVSDSERVLESSAHA